MRLRPDDFLDEVEWRDMIDQHYTRSWLEFTYGGLFTRKGLDDRTRLLVSVAQFLAMGELEELERQILSPENRVKFIAHFLVDFLKAWSVREGTLLFDIALPSYVIKDSLMLVGILL